MNYVYITTNAYNRVLYTGVTNDLKRRLSEHRNGKDVFTSRYHAGKLVYFELHPDIRTAIAREKQIKSWRRQKKIELIKQLNPGWLDLAETMGSNPLSV